MLASRDRLNERAPGQHDKDHVARPSWGHADLEETAYSTGTPPRNCEAISKRHVVMGPSWYYNTKYC